MANSGWAWHLFAAPAIRIAHWRGVPVVVNYRGGLAAEFLAEQARVASGATLRRAAALVVPSRFLQEVFARHGMPAQIIPNVVDVTTFRPAEPRHSTVATAPHLVVTRNLEQLYGNDIALRALARVRQQLPGARLSIAGSGPERDRSANAWRTSSVSTDAVRFTGRLETAGHGAALPVGGRRAESVPGRQHAEFGPRGAGLRRSGGQHQRGRRAVPRASTAARRGWCRRTTPKRWPRRRCTCWAIRRCGVNWCDNGLDLARGCAWPVVKDQWLGLYVRLASERRQHAARPAR